MTNEFSHVDVESISNYLRKANIAQVDELAALATKALRMTTSRVSLKSLPLGSSRFGGSPDVPLEFVWPTRNGRPLTFLAQLDLSEMDVPDLPETGWLLFFYDVVEQPWGFDPKDAGCAVVNYIDGERANLENRSHPEIDSTGGPFEACALSYSVSCNLPDLWDSLIEDAGLPIDMDHWEEYCAAAAAVAGVEDGAIHHHLLGHPQLVQNDMRRECQLASNGIYCGDSNGYEGERAKSFLRQAANEWVLLLQIDTDEEGPGWMWGDCGRIYYWIRRADLAARDFGKVWLVLQCS